MPAKKTTTKKTVRKGTRERGPAAPRGPEATEGAIDLGDESGAEVTKRITKAGGAALAAYKDPYGGTPLVLASLPLRSIEATEFQRDLSKVHADRLSDA